LRSLLSLSSNDALALAKLDEGRGSVLPSTNRSLDVLDRLLTSVHTASAARAAAGVAYRAARIRRRLASRRKRERRERERRKQRNSGYLLPHAGNSFPSRSSHKALPRSEEARYTPTPACCALQAWRWMHLGSC